MGQPESGDNCVDDQQHAALQQLKDDHRQAVLILIEQPAHVADIAERCDPHILGHRLREAHLAGGGQRHLCLRAHRVIAALAFDDLVFADISPREPDLLRAEHRPDGLFGQFDLREIVGKERHALGKPLEYRLDPLRVIMAEQHGDGADEEIDIFAAILVPHARALSARNDDAGIKNAKAPGTLGRLRAGGPIAPGV